jgi:hypothetical protein
MVCIDSQFVTVWFVCIVESAVVDEIKQDGDLPGLLHSLYRWLDYESLATASMSCMAML